MMRLYAKIPQMAKCPIHMYFCKAELARARPAGAPLSASPSCTGEVTRVWCEKQHDCCWGLMTVGKLAKPISWRLTAERITGQQHWSIIWLAFSQNRDPPISVYFPVSEGGGPRMGRLLGLLLKLKQPESALVLLNVSILSHHVDTCWCFPPLYSGGRLLLVVPLQLSPQTKETLLAPRGPPVWVFFFFSWG